MADQNNSLTDQERAELEQLRAEKAARQEQEAAQRERAELEQLRAEKVQQAQRAAEDAQLEQARQRMEPDDDLRMPVAQKIVLAICFVLLIAGIIYVVTAPMSAWLYAAGLAPRHSLCVPWRFFVEGSSIDGRHL